MSIFFFFFNDTATTEIYTYVHTLSLHDALPICFYSFGNAHFLRWRRKFNVAANRKATGHHSPWAGYIRFLPKANDARRSEEHTSELQSLMRISYAVFCLKKKKTIYQLQHILTHYITTVYSVIYHAIYIIT